MKNLQKNTLKKILEAEQLSISALANTVEVNRGALSKLLNHNTQLTSDNWSKLSEAYPEHVEEIATTFVKKEMTKGVFKAMTGKNPTKKDLEKTISIKIIDPSKEEKENRVISGTIEVESKKLPAQKATPSVSAVEQPVLTKEQKEIKTKEENRHRNLNCPESGYHMKVPYRDLQRARPLCPLTQLPMMVKEEVKKYKELDEVERKTFIASLNSSINLLK